MYISLGDAKGANMVKYIIAEQLVGKEVVTSDGFDLGKFVDAEVSESNGKLNTLVIEPNVDSEFVNKLNVKSGRLSVPYTSVMAVNDFIVVDRKNLV
jgi:sporulation protein YlmC with PRC-barrel domain